MLHQIKEWTSFYKKHFNLVLGDVVIPEHQPGFDRLIVVAGSLTQNQVYDACAKQFKCWRYKNDLDKSVAKNDRDPKNGAYAIWLRDCQEADEENKNLSADYLENQKVKGITLLERMLYELKYKDEPGNHLDTSSVTLCSGSRDSRDILPTAYWKEEEFGINWYYADGSNDILRARSVVL